jgi:UDP-glucose 4-epimerase
VNVISAALDQTMLRTDVAMGILNVGTGNQTSIKSLAENMLSVSGTNFGVEIQKTRSGDITRSVADTRKLKNAIGFVPNTLLKCGLRSILTQLNLR